ANRRAFAGGWFARPILKQRIANGEWRIENRNAPHPIRYSPFAIRSTRRPVSWPHAGHAPAHWSAPGGGGHVMGRAGRMRGERKKRAEGKAADVRPPGDSTSHIRRHQFGRAL